MTSFNLGGDKTNDKTNQNTRSEIQMSEKKKSKIIFFSKRVLFDPVVKNNVKAFKH